jgi:hypothetical protein
MFLESCSAGSFQLRRGVSAEHKINKYKTRAVFFSHRLEPPEARLTLNGRSTSFVVQHEIYLGVIFDKRIYMEISSEMTEAKTFTTSITVYSLFKRERLSANIKPNLHKVLIISVMTYSCLVCEFEADTHILKCHRLENKVLRTTGKFSDAHRSASCTWLPKYCIFMIT